MTDWTTEVLENLYTNYGPTPSDLTHLFTSKLILNHPGYLPASSQARDVLNALEEEGYITWKVAMHLIAPGQTIPSWHFETLYRSWFGQPALLGETPLTFDNCRVEGHLTVKGLFLMHERRSANEARAESKAVNQSTISFNQSALDLNEQIKSHNSVVLWATVVIGLATVVQAVIAGLSYNQAKTPIPVELQPVLQPVINIDEVRSDTVHVIYVKPSAAGKKK